MKMMTGICVPAMLKKVRIIIIASLKSLFLDVICSPCSCSIARFILGEVLVDDTSEDVLGKAPISQTNIICKSELPMRRDVNQSIMLREKRCHVE